MSYRGFTTPNPPPPPPDTQKTCNGVKRSPLIFAFTETLWPALKGGDPAFSLKPPCGDFISPTRVFVAKNRLQQVHANGMQLKRHQHEFVVPFHSIER
jgi:hypothetical protein